MTDNNALLHFDGSCMPPPKPPEKWTTRLPTLAESWAVGGTGTRPGEDLDNAKHYAELAKQAADASGYMWLYIEGGGLYFDKTEGAPVGFYLDGGGLYVEVA